MFDITLSYTSMTLSGRQAKKKEKKKKEEETKQAEKALQKRRDT